MKKSLLCIGDINGDLVVPYGQMLSAIRQCEAGGSPQAPHVAFQPGGSVTNTCLALAKLGEQPELLGKVGSDGNGEALLKQLEGQGVRTGRVLQGGGATFIVIVVLDEQGERIMFPWMPAGACDGCFTAGETDRFDAESCGWIHTSGLALKGEGEHEQELIRFLRRCKQNGAVLSFDLNIRPESLGFTPGRKELFYEVAAMSDYIFGSGTDELGTMTGVFSIRQAAVQLAKESGAAVVARDGAHPVLLIQDGTVQEFPLFPVQQLHKVGAGDSFNAGFIACMRAGGSAERAVRWGNRCAAHTISHTQPMSVPPRAELDHLM